MRALYLLLLLLLLTGCTTYISGNGDVITATMDVEPFTSVSLQWQGDIYLSQGDVMSVTVEAESNIIAELDIEAAGGELKIKKKDLLAVLRPTEDVRYYVTMPIVEEVSIAGSGDVIGQTRLHADELVFSIAGSGDITLNRIEAEKVQTNIAGSGNVKLNDVIVNEMETNIAGSGRVYLSGVGLVHTHEVSGSGDLYAEDFITNMTSISIAGSGKSQVHALERLDITIAGSGDVYYAGNPRIDQRISGSGNILQQR